MIETFHKNIGFAGLMWYPRGTAEQAMGLDG
jgi:hypothetical protein